MRGKPSRRLHSKDDLKKHKKGKDHVAKEIARQDTLNDYDQLQVKPIPSHLCYYGKQEWKRIIPLLQQLPIAELDRQMIESYCQLHGFKRRLQKDIQEFGEVTNFYDEDGNLTNRRINPSYNAYLSTVKEIRMIANQLGMTINSRLELAIPDGEKEEDEILKLLKG
ncbi:phage terminase small subunit P27 family [Siminovitchia terrae]|uniref:Phage terminase small subunit P27 family n=1 Tax=Siminovitchia terrae TaxID=1914933 RepID=A0A429X8J2_SIMTE|nr:phage terminase small subunit P27 family [Siminovitchia terrae]RST59699.1 phage terminase small subunit P27 family [Siminovitchia terrae]